MRRAIWFLGFGLLSFQVHAWNSEAELYYFSANNSSYLLPTVSFETDQNLHLEARYNYEDLETFSLFAGRIYNFGNAFKFKFIPMIGAAGGRTEGVIPGFEISIDYGKWSLYSEVEYFFGTESEEDTFFYQWSDVTYHLIDWLGAGVSFQRLRPYKSDRIVDYGVFTQIITKQATIGAYYFFVKDDPLWILSFVVDF